MHPGMDKDVIYVYVHVYFHVHVWILQRLCELFGHRHGHGKLLTDIIALKSLVLK